MRFSSKKNNIKCPPRISDMVIQTVKFPPDIFVVLMQMVLGLVIIVNLVRDTVNCPIWNVYNVKY